MLQYSKCHGSVIRMKKYIYGLVGVLLFSGCAHEHQINIGEINLQERSTTPLKHRDYYISFTQEYYDNKRYPIRQYCDDQRSYLADDKFSTETYIKVTNERTKQSRVGKYPIWFLLNDDSSNISCIHKSTNFINEEPFIVSDTDKLSLKVLQKNEAATTVPVRELGVLIDVVSLFVPRTATFLMRANNIIKDPVTQNYLNLLDESFKNGDIDGTKNRDFTTKVANLKVKLYVPKDGKRKELGYILIKPKYRSTLTTVDTINGTPNFRFVYNSSDPRVVDLMEYILPERKIPIKVLVENFKQVADEYVVEALSSLNTQLMNRFTRFDRALILTLALRESNLYRRLVQAIKSKNLPLLKDTVKILNDKRNPLLGLLNELKVTNIEYYRLMYQAQEAIKVQEELEAKQREEAERLRQEQLAYLVAIQGIENFFRPVATGSYLPEMFTPNSEIKLTTGEVLTFIELQQRYERETNVKDYGCYTALQRGIKIQLKSGNLGQLTVQDYLIHPNYAHGIKYDYMAISVNKQNEVDIIFYKLTSKGTLKIEKMLIDRENRFISKRRMKEILNGNMVQECSENIRRLF